MPPRPQRFPQATLRISEIFHSIQGESTRVGLPTVFIRLTGCPLRCVWCDTAYAFTGGDSILLDEVLRRVAEFGCRTVCVTGGEPMAQKSSLALLNELCAAAYDVSLETSGAIDLAEVDQCVSKIMDIKTPGSGEAERNLWTNLEYLTARDEIKFVLASASDYAWAKEVMVQRKLAGICPVLFSPVQGKLDPAQLAGWILQDRLEVRFQLQLHKLLWGMERGR